MPDAWLDMQGNLAAHLAPGRRLGTMRIKDWAVTDLPQPLSPITPSERPSKIWKLTPSTALTVPSCRKK
jgi:hypothetical protein